MMLNSDLDPSLADAMLYLTYDSKISSNKIVIKYNPAFPDIAFMDENIFDTNFYKEYPLILRSAITELATIHRFTKLQMIVVKEEWFEIFENIEKPGLDARPVLPEKLWTIIMSLNWPLKSYLIECDINNALFGMAKALGII